MAATVRPASARRPPTSANVAHTASQISVGLVLDPSRAGEVLGELAVGHVDHPGLLVDDERPHAGRPGIDGDHGTPLCEASEGGSPGLGPAKPGLPGGPFGAPCALTIASSP